MPTLTVVAAEMQRMFTQHSQNAGSVIDIALDLLESCGLESWEATGGTRQAKQFEVWRGSREPLEALKDPTSSRLFPVYIQALALSQCLPSIRIGLTRSALICMHGFFAQGRASLRATVEECLYAFMVIREPERGRDYLVDHDKMWRESTALRRAWEQQTSATQPTHPSLPLFATTFVSTYQKAIHSGSHGGFAQAAHRTRGMSQTFVDTGSPRLGAWSVAFAVITLRLIDALTAHHPGVDKPTWAAGYAAFERAAQPFLASLQPTAPPKQI